jgi:hypothetical protein
MVTDRQEFIAQARSGRCGNTPFMWTVGEYVEQADLMGTKYMPEVFVTSVNYDQFRFYWKTCRQVRALLQEAERNNGLVSNPRRPGSFVALDDIVVMESPSFERQCKTPVFQGEYMAGDRYLRYAHTLLTWGLCKRQGYETHVNGMRAEQTMRQWMGPYAQHLFEVAEAWPDHTIEFSHFPWNMGIWDTRPLVWEVRAY